MRPIGCPETSVRNYQYSLRNSPEESSSRLLRGESLKSRMLLLVCIISMSDGARTYITGEKEISCYVCTVQTRPWNEQMPAKRPCTPFSTQFAIVLNSVMFCFSILMPCSVFSKRANRQFTFRCNALTSAIINAQVSWYTTLSGKTAISPSTLRKCKRGGEIPPLILHLRNTLRWAVSSLPWKT
jgi:hypothetical protein